MTVPGDLRTTNVVAVQAAISVEDHRYENDFCRPSLILLCHKIIMSHRTSTAWAYVETGDKPHGELIANGSERISRVALRAADFPSQCNLREQQVSGVLRSLFWR